MEKEDVVYKHGKLTLVNENNEPSVVISDKAKDELFEEAFHLISNDHQYNDLLLTINDYALESDNLREIIAFLIRVKQILNDAREPIN